ncbi:MAG: transposase [bacterium]|nr:transposase [bacterium]
MLSRLSKAPKATAYFKQEKLGLLPEGDHERLNIWSPALVSVLSYCLMPNHFHFLLKEETWGGVAKFMQRLGNGYTKYFNTREEREGRLFTAKYKRVHVQDDEQLVHTSRYIHLNPNASSFTNVPISRLQSYPWSSLGLFLKGRSSLLCQPDEILKLFSTLDEYWDFVSSGAEDSLERFPKDLFIDVDTK